MTLTAEIKARIDGMSYEEMLRKWRFAPVGDPMFVGEVGNYFASVFNKKRVEVGDEGHTKASKNIGWSGVTIVRDIR